MKPQTCVCCSRGTIFALSIFAAISYSQRCYSSVLFILHLFIIHTVEAVRVWNLKKGEAGTTEGFRGNGGSAMHDVN